MDQEEAYPEENQHPEQELSPEEYQEETPAYTVAPPVEGAFSKYLREYRLLNSLLVSLLALTLIMGSIWGMMMGLALAEEGNSNFSDGGAAPSAQKQEKQKVVKLMQRQKKAQPTTQKTFVTTAISDISMPEFNDLDVKDLAPVVEAAAPTMSDAGMNNDKMKKAMAGIGLTLPKTMQQRCDPKKRIARLKSGGGKTMTEAAIVRGLKWLQTVQDPEGSWGGKDKDDQGNPKSTDKNAMTGMALLCYLGHCELQDSPDFGPTVQKAIKFITSSHTRTKD
jgi:hypothetical protein